MLRRAWLRLWATPIFTIFAVVSLALGVGVTTAIYSVILSLTRNAIVAPNAGRVGLVVAADSSSARLPTWRSVMSRADFEDLARATPSLGIPAASAAFYQAAVSPALAELLSGEAVTGNYFSYLGLTPVRGRLIQPSDDHTPMRAAVLSGQLWRARFASDESVVGQSIRLGGEPFEIVGIAPEVFRGLATAWQAPTGVWIPLSAAALFPSEAAPPADPLDRRRRQLSVFFQLLADRPVRAVSSEVFATAQRLDAAFPIDVHHDASGPPVRQPREWSVGTMTAVNREIDSQSSTTQAVVMAIVGLVLVVACTNLANLVLARGSSRTHELAVRRALGASRTRLVAEQLAETSILAALGGIGAYLVMRVLMIWFASASLPVSESAVVQLAPRFDATTLTWAAVSLLASLVVFGLAPAIHLTRVELRPALSTESGSTGQLKWRTRRTLIAVQVMISLSFFLVAAFAARAVDAEGTSSSGVDVDRLAVGVFNFALPPWTEARAREAIDRLMALVPSQPGFASVAVTSGMPFGTNYTPGTEVTTIDKPFSPNRTDFPTPLVAGTPSVFATLGVAIVRGRAFDERDAAGTEPVAVISERTAARLFGTVDVIGRQLLIRYDTLTRLPDEQRTIIGVAGDTDSQQRGSRSSGVVWVPLSQHYEPRLTLVARTSGDPADLIVPMKTLAQRANPDLVLDRPGTATLTLTGRAVLLGIVSRLSAALAVLALALGMAGLFGVMSHLVSRRRREMGLRMALGAAPLQIRWLVVRDGLQPVVSGLIMGYLIAIAVRLILAFSRPLSIGEMAVFFVAPLPITVAALVACYWPATRASRVDPNVALKEL